MSRQFIEMNLINLSKVNNNAKFDKQISIGKNVKRLKSFCGKKTLSTARVGNVFYLIRGW